MNDQNDTPRDEVQRDDDFEAFEEKLDELHAGLREAYTAGYKEAMRHFNVDADFDPGDLDDSEFISECHYYYWDGKTKPLESWLREQILDDEQLVTDGGEDQDEALKLDDLPGDAHDLLLDYKAADESVAEALNRVFAGIVPHASHMPDHVDVEGDLLDQEFVIVHGRTTDDCVEEYVYDNAGAFNASFGEPLEDADV